MSHSPSSGGFAQIAHSLRQMAIDEGSGDPLAGHVNGHLDICMEVAQAQRSEMRTLRGMAEKGVNHVAKYLKESGFPIKPASGTHLFFNILFHVFILMVALTVLYVFNVAPLEHRALQRQVAAKIREGMGEALQGMTPTQQQALQDMSPALAQMIEVYGGEDPKRKLKNKNTMSFAYGIIAVLGFIFIAGIMVLKFGAGVDTGKSVAEIIFENLIIFAIVGAAEFTFFKLVSINYIPIMPSALGRDAIGALKKSFSGSNSLKENSSWYNYSIRFF